MRAPAEAEQAPLCQFCNQFCPLSHGTQIFAPNTTPPGIPRAGHFLWMHRLCARAALLRARLAEINHYQYQQFRHGEYRPVGEHLFSCLETQLDAVTVLSEYIFDPLQERQELIDR